MRTFFSERVRSSDRAEDAVPASAAPLPPRSRSRRMRCPPPHAGVARRLPAARWMRLIFDVGLHIGYIGSKSWERRCSTAVVHFYKMINGFADTLWYPHLGPAASWRVHTTHTTQGGVPWSAVAQEATETGRQRLRGARPCARRRRPSAASRTPPFEAREVGQNGGLVANARRVDALGVCRRHSRIR